MICPSCGYENSEDAQYCGLCQASFVKDQPESPGLTAHPPKRDARAGPIETRQQNWFNRHLNWTWVLAQVAVFIISVFFVIILASVLMTSSNSGYSEGSLFTTMLLFQNMVLVLEVFAIFGVGAWALKKKNRNLAWLLILLVPFGWFFFLLLENRSEMSYISSAFNPAKTTLEPRSQSW